MVAASNEQKIVNEVMAEFVRYLRDRDLEGALGLFHDDAILFGSEAGESALGIPELRAFFGRLFERPQTYGWTWEATTARRRDRVVWFVAPATVVIRGGDGSERFAPYRLSGVLEQEATGRWLFSLFNGAEPVSDRID